VSKPPAKPPRGLNDDDLELWHYASKQLTPLQRGKSRVRAGADQLDVPAGVAKPKKKEAAHEEPVARPAPPTKAAAIRTPAPKSPPPVAAFDPRNAKKLKKGRIEIEGRIDLHGMRQSEAHTALRRFLMSSHAKGKRWVLVITGKGGSASRIRDADGGYGRPEPGVLKRNVPMWLAEPELRAIIVSFADAAIEHGGSGALYVHLRKSDRF
jgi:DNA-nicking Smr family endonuclease